ncbi:MAG: TspO/MBR family protein [Aureispira sp.]
MHFRPIPATLIFFVLNFGALGIGSALMGDGPMGDWYQGLNKAPWTPPGWVFGAAWTTIMICFSIFMGAAWNTVKDRQRLAILYGVQWILNVSWNPIFFHFQEMASGLVVITLLTFLVWYFIFSYKRAMRNKMLLIAPYGVWLLIATTLNAYALWMN